MRYQRDNVAAGTYIFTVNLADGSTDTRIPSVEDFQQVISQAEKGGCWASFVCANHKIYQRGRQVWRAGTH